MTGKSFDGGVPFAHRTLAALEQVLYEVRAEVRQGRSAPPGTTSYFHVEVRLEHLVRERKADAAKAQAARAARLLEREAKGEPVSWGGADGWDL